MDIAVWLQDLGLERYVGAFSDNDIDAAVLPSLTGDDLEQLGVTSVGHRRKLLDAIAALRVGTVSTGPATAAPAGDTRSADQTAPPSAQGERRQTTVLFCDLVGSTKLSARLDPEDMSELLHAYRNCCAETIARWDGYLARYMGDGVLAYFGWPRAHEDDAERAVRAGLALVEAVPMLPAKERLQVRVGIGTGLTVVGDLVGSGDAQERGIVGESPNLAARLQGLAAPNSVVIGPATRSLLGDLFELRDLGPVEVKGLAEPVHAYAVLRASAAESRFEALHSNVELTPLVGRDEEIGLIERRWARAKQGDGQIVLLAGEPGIGKSRLTAALLDKLAREPHTRLRYFCSPHHTASALYPFIRQFERAAGFERSDSTQAKLDKLEIVWGSTTTAGEELGLIADLLSLPYADRYPKLGLTPQRHRERTLEAMTKRLVRLAAAAPALIIFEDAHWADQTSLDLINRFVAAIRALPVLFVVTFRPEFLPPWAGQPQVTMLTLSRLAHREGAALARRILGDASLPAAIIDEVVDRSDGVPLFLEEITKAVMEAGGTDATDRLLRISSAASVVPATLYASLMARLDRLPLGKEIAQIGSAIGREFSSDLLAAVACWPHRKLGEAIAQLAGAGLIFQSGTPPETTLLFKHALIQDAAYGAMLRGRRQELHARIAHVLEERFPKTVETEPELIAYHLATAGQSVDAIPYWLKAGGRAAARSANKEAVNHLKAGIKLLDDLPESPGKLRLELNLRSTLNQSLMALYGYSAEDVGTGTARVVNLCRQIGTTAEFAVVLFQSWAFNHTRAIHSTALTLGEELEERMRGSDDPEARMVAHFPIGLSLMSLGRLQDAVSHFEKAAEFYKRFPSDPTRLRYGIDMSAGVHPYFGWTLWTLGYPATARKHLEGLVARLERLNHPFTTARCLVWCFNVSAACRDWPAAYQAADQAARISDEHGFAMTSFVCHICRGAARAALDPGAQTIVEMRDSLAGYKGLGGRVQLPNFLGLYAQTLMLSNDWDAAESALSEASAVMDETGERHLAAEIDRMKGTLTVRSRRGDPEPHFLAAMDIARRQDARMLELRAARDLARLWRDQGKPRDAHDMLAPVYGWFTEGFDLPDLTEARTLLNELVLLADN